MWRARWLVALALVACDPAAPPLPDAARGDAGCTDDRACDDGLFCTGAERCVAGECRAGTPPSCDDGAACTTDACDEATRRCRHDPPDADGDGRVDRACGGDDCDDADPARFPGNVEICDRDDRDEDCDPSTAGFADDDGDGAGSAACCNGAGDARACGRDCDDGDASIRPGQGEACNGADDDCDGAIDERVTRSFVIDADGDGHGSDAAGAETRTACALPAGFASAADDCDDTRGDVHPGAPERCDAPLDEDCDGAADPPEICACTDGESIPCRRPGRCALGTEVCVDGAWSACSVAPTAEVCGAEDDDCDGAVDEGLVQTCWDDPDADGWAALTAASTMICGGDCPPGTTTRAPTAGARDCRPDDPRVHPEQDGWHAEPLCVETCELPSGAIGCAGRGICRPARDTQWDYDCDGAASPPPPATACGASCGDCGGGGFVHDATACGELVQRRTCACAADACSEQLETEVLPCR